MSVNIILSSFRRKIMSIITRFLTLIYNPHSIRILTRCCKRYTHLLVPSVYNILTHERVETDVECERDYTRNFHEIYQDLDKDTPIHPRMDPLSAYDGLCQQSQKSESAFSKIDEITREKIHDCEVDRQHYHKLGSSQYIGSKQDCPHCKNTNDSSLPNKKTKNPQSEFSSGRNELALKLFDEVVKGHIINHTLQQFSPIPQPLIDYIRGKIGDIPIKEVELQGYTIESLASQVHNVAMKEIDQYNKTRMKLYDYTHPVDNRSARQAALDQLAEHYERGEIHLK